MGEPVARDSDSDRTCQADLLDGLLHEQAELLVGGSPDEYTPFVPAAVRLWEEFLGRHPDDYEAVHHLAVSYHARAFDVERRQPGSARHYWHKAIRHWDHLAQLDDFWLQLKREGANLGDQFDPRTVDAFRDALPTALLAVHQGFAVRYFAADQMGAVRSHMDVIRASGLCQPLIQQCLRQLFADAVGEIDVENARQDTLDPVLENVSKYLQIAPDYCPGLLLAVRIANRINDLHWAESQAGDRDRNETLAVMRTVVCRTEPWSRRLKGAMDRDELDSDVDLMIVREALAEQFHVLGLCHALDSEPDSRELEEQLRFFLDSMRFDSLNPPRALTSAALAAMDLCETFFLEQSHEGTRALVRRIEGVLQGTTELDVLRVLVSALDKMAHGDAPSLNELSVQESGCGSRFAAIIVRSMFSCNWVDQAVSFVQSWRQRDPTNATLLFELARLLCEKGEVADANRFYQEFCQEAAPRLREQGNWLGTRIARETTTTGLLERIDDVQERFHGPAGDSIRDRNDLLQIESEAPDVAFIFFRLAIAYLDMGFLTEAEESYRRFQSLASPEEIAQGNWFASRLLDES